MNSQYGSGESFEPDTIYVLLEDPEQNVDTRDPRIVVAEDYPGTPYRLIRIPRYVQFVDIMLKLARFNYKIVEIAGNDEIQFKVRIISTDKDPCRQVLGCKMEYSWPISTDVTRKYAALNVSVPQFSSVVSHLDASNIRIEYIHDY